MIIIAVLFPTHHALHPIILLAFEVESLVWKDPSVYFVRTFLSEREVTLGADVQLDLRDMVEEAKGNLREVMSRCPAAGDLLTSYVGLDRKDNLL
jgi:hypothetical protein